MQNQLIDLAVAFSAQSKVWKNTKISWLDFVSKLEKPRVQDVLFKQFKNLNKTDAGKLKDVGGYVGGYLRGGKRSPANVSSRQLLTLDIDFGTLDFWEAFTFVYGCEAFIHGTMSHCAETPRYRLLIPLSRECASDEYSAVARKVAGTIGIEFFDNTTFEVNRLMFWPTICKDVDFYSEKQSGEWLDVDSVLASYRDWQDVSEWPTNKQASEEVKDRADKQEDPLEKRGVIGAFCRAFSVEDALARFLPDKYSEGSEGRYTYLKGSTANGLVVYESKFAFSHHGTDPTSGKLCNAFDLVRLHKFGELDTAPNSLKSLKAMEAFCMTVPEVKREITRGIKEAWASDFEVEGSEAGKLPINTDWVDDLDMDQKGTIFLATSKNIDLILENDARLKGIFAFNIFDSKPYLKRSAPWRAVKGAEPFEDVDFSGLRNYIEKTYTIASREKLDDSLKLELSRNAFHPIVDYLNSLEWDQVERVDSIFVDYFGLEDSAYAREAARKSLCGAVARVFNPGCKFDLMPVIIGEEGIYKSTFWRKLGKDWYSDTFFKVDGKEALEQIQGAWIIEMAELAGFRKGEAESVKHFISKQQDEFRPAYGHVRKIYKRQCVFVGTTNWDSFLKDPTGNRRFLPIQSNPFKITKSVDVDLISEEVDQIWAEAVYLLGQGEKLYLSPAVEQLAKGIQASHMERDDRAGVIESFLEMPLPADWPKRDVYDRVAYFADKKNQNGAPRKEVSVAEIWVECFNKNQEDMSRYNTREINDILRSLGWQFSNTVKAVASYGKQRIFIK